MPSPIELVWALLENIAYDVSKRWLLYLIMIGAGHFFVRFVLDRLRARREIFVFWLSTFVLLAGLGTLVSARPQEPNLIGSVANVVLGDTNGGKDTLVAIEMTILNAGAMQSIAKGWQLEATLNGIKYPATLIDMPSSTFTFVEDAGSHNSITYHKEDLLASKAMASPIQPGGLMPGILFAVFDGLKRGQLENGSEVTVTFEDVFSKKYAAMAKTTAQRKDKLSTLPGLHTDMICPVPTVTPPASLPPKS